MRHDTIRQAEPYLQTWWDWRAAGNFMFGGTASGLIIVTTATLGYRIDVTLFVLAGLALMGLGLGLVWLEIGRRLRAMNVFRHPHMSWMTRESYAALLTFGAGAAAILTRLSPVLILAAIGALLFVYCQARILKAAKGIPVWREQRLMAFIMLTGLTEGLAAFMLLAAGLGLTGLAYFPPLAALLLDFAPTLLFLALWVRLAAWWVYHGKIIGSIPDRAATVVARLNRHFLLVGGIAPIVLTGLAWGLLFGLRAADLNAAGAAGTGLAAMLLLALAALLALASGWWAKYVLIAQASYTQGFAIPKRPARGPRGTGGPGVKPGWPAKQER